MRQSSGRRRDFYGNKTKTKLSIRICRLSEKGLTEDKERERERENNTTKETKGKSFRSFFFFFLFFSISQVKKP